MAKKSDYPHVAILMIPLGQKPGNLETLCLEAAYDKWRLQVAVETYTSATPAARWNLGKQSKMKLQAILAATCMDRPEAGFVGHWRARNEYHIPLDHTCFEPIVEFLQSFPALAGA